MFDKYLNLFVLEYLVVYLLNFQFLLNSLQDELCARMQVMGYQISRSDISKLENGKKFITDFELLGFSKALKVSILDLFD